MFGGDVSFFREPLYQSFFAFMDQQKGALDRREMEREREREFSAQASEDLRTMGGVISALAGPIRSTPEALHLDSVLAPSSDARSP